MLRHTGWSQKQAVAPLQGTSWFVASTVKHCSPEQQLASVVQACEVPEQEGGGAPQTPLLQTSVALQQGIVEEQDWPVFAQVGATAGAVQVPLVAPGAMTHASGEQQSPFAVQLPPVETQLEVGVAAHRPVVPSQYPEQHWVPAVQPRPFDSHEPQNPPAQMPVQQSDGWLQGASIPPHEPAGGAERQTCPLVVE